MTSKKKGMNTMFQYVLVKLNNIKLKIYIHSKNVFKK